LLIFVVKLYLVKGQAGWLSAGKYNTSRLVFHRAYYASLLKDSSVRPQA
jgi:hypothetical protein